jgi:Mrp family chromosome partitioning ATPase
MDRISLALKRAREEYDGKRKDMLQAVSDRALTVDTARSDLSIGKIFQLDSKILHFNRILCGNDSESVTTAYKILRTHVRQKMRAGGWKILAVTSPGPNQGKTLTSINLAFSVAQDLESAVVLVDLDLRRPSIHQYLGISPEYGVSDYFKENVNISLILSKLSLDRITLVPGRESVQCSSEALASNATAALINEVKAGHPNRFVIIDLPPLLTSDDVLAVLPNVDCVLLVIEDGSTTKQDLMQSVQLLGTTPILGTVLNKSTQSVPYYY